MRVFAFGLVLLSGISFSFSYSSFADELEKFKAETGWTVSVAGSGGLGNCFNEQLRYIKEAIQQEGGWAPPKLRNVYVQQERPLVSIQSANEIRSKSNRAQFLVTMGDSMGAEDLPYPTDFAGLVVRYQAGNLGHCYPTNLDKIRNNLKAAKDRLGLGGCMSPPQVSSGAAAGAQVNRVK